jgi:hypothetical protein
MSARTELRKPSFLSGALVALALAAAAGVAFSALTSALGSAAAIRTIVTLLGAAYVLYLVGNGAHKTGRLVVVTAWCVGAALIACFVSPLALFLIAHTAAIWFVRTLYFHGSITPLLCDFGLSALALAAAVWAARGSDSVFLATWTFFLTQALFVALPSRTTRAEAASDGDDSFRRARQSAEAAMRRLTN